ncbi:MAG: hypothetical protein ABTR07_02310 [Candidatus Competibacter denitrificans]
MSRIRSIKPEFWTSEQVVECSPTARLLFIGFWNFADDNGVLPASPRQLKMLVFPGDDFTLEQISGMVDELLRQGLLAEFTGEDGRKYWCVTGWKAHQKIEKPSCKFPAPPAKFPKFADQSPTSRRPVADGVEWRGKEGKGRGKEGRVSAPARNVRSPKTPLPADLAITDSLQAWATEHGYLENLQQHLDSFRDKATAKDYRYTDWQAALRNAIRDDWAGLRKQAAPGGGRIRRESGITVPVTPQGAEFDTLLRNLSRPALEGELVHASH